MSAGGGRCGVSSSVSASASLDLGAALMLVLWRHDGGMRRPVSAVDATDGAGITVILWCMNVSNDVRFVRRVWF